MARSPRRRRSSTAPSTRWARLGVDDSTREGLLRFAEDSAGDDDRTRVVRMLRLIVSTPDFQFA